MKRYIFIDGGSHKGKHIAVFEKSALYSQHSWEMFAFEANPALIPYIPKRSNLTILNKAICFCDGKTNFYVGKDSVSSSLLEYKRTGQLREKPITVEAIDFGRWIKKNFDINDYILVELDIEGAEYGVLEKMILDGSINYIDELIVEFHNIKVFIPRQRDEELIKRIKGFGISIREGRFSVLLKKIRNTI